jgi:hypothetical protein
MAAPWPPIHSVQDVEADRPVKQAFVPEKKQALSDLRLSLKLEELGLDGHRLGDSYGPPGWLLGST